MKSSKAMIMSVEGRCTVAYTEDGHFMKIPKKSSHQVGQVLNIENVEYNRPAASGMWRIAAVAAAVLLLVFMGTVYPVQQAQAYLSMELNTGGVEFWTDQNNKVIKVKYADSINDLTNIQLKGKDVYEAVSALTSEVKRMGMLEDKDGILLVNLAELKNQGKNPLEESKIKEAIMKALNEEQYSGMMMVVSKHDREFIERANELRLTASQYYVYEQGKAKGYELTTEKIKHGQMRNVLNEVGTSPEELFGMHRTVTKNSLQGQEDSSANKGSRMQSGSGWRTPTSNHMSMPDNNQSPTPNTFEGSPMTPKQPMNMR
ncbi:anti-sigma factor domain-containing protein [Thermanaerosceptrum fracticalcis]|uniref:Anti-sigma factor domain-containing protein n=1 Tax=Thermanaerosceptrum fracticalcis TaxID=1712410 RepID=A0A7G6E3X8_THEFR|nr:anti-sigma factor domain-containing protein [Thermanaerosceptrum fracticalcis]QNB46782.1 anti-sigma factor domain-containing protein [Thermanaerosceptrum fracticalcis]